MSRAALLVFLLAQILPSGQGLSQDTVGSLAARAEQFEARGDW